jgi:hypothetical protein
MYGMRDRIFFVSGSARIHRHGEQWHEKSLNDEGKPSRAFRPDRATDPE